MAENIKWGGSLAFPAVLSSVYRLLFHLVLQLLFSSGRSVFFYLFLCFTISRFLPMSVALTHRLFYLLIFSVWPLFLSSLCLSLISGFRVPSMNRSPNKSITCPTHCPFSVISCSLFPRIGLHLQNPYALPLCRYPPRYRHKHGRTHNETHTHMHTCEDILLPASNHSALFPPISFFPPRDRGLTSWKSHQRCIALNNS